MNHRSLYCAGCTPAIQYARTFLAESGITVADSPQWECGHLLLDVPSFRPGSPFSSGGNLDTLLSALPRDIVVWGGALNHPSLKGYHTKDLLTDETYLTENAAITAHCAIGITAPTLTSTFQDCNVLITGWGRIGKALAPLLKAVGADVTVAARKLSDRTDISEHGFHTSDYESIAGILPYARVIFNTVPEMVLPEQLVSLCKNCVKIDLASKDGIGGADVVRARGLPGIHAPESSGNLIAKTVLRHMKEA